MDIKLYLFQSERNSHQEINYHQSIKKTTSTRESDSGMWTMLTAHSDKTLCSHYENQYESLL